MPESTIPGAAEVFISYKTEDHARANWVRQCLESSGISCWMAPHSIPGGASYASQIPQAIAACRYFVLILSSRTQKSKWVIRELDRAINEDKIILPFVIEPCELNAEYRFYLTNVQYYYAHRDMDAALRALIQRIRPMTELPAVNPLGAVQATDAPAKPRRKKWWLIAPLAVVTLVLGLLSYWFLSGFFAATEQPLTDFESFRATAMAATGKLGCGDLWDPSSLQNVYGNDEWTVYHTPVSIPESTALVMFERDDLEVILTVNNLTEQTLPEAFRLAECVSASVYNTTFTDFLNIMENRDLYPLADLPAEESLPNRTVIPDAAAQKQDPGTQSSSQYILITFDQENFILYEIRTRTYQGTTYYDLFYLYTRN